MRITLHIKVGTRDISAREAKEKSHISELPTGCSSWLTRVQFQCMGPTGGKCTTVATHHSFTCVTRLGSETVRKQARPYHLMASILQIKAGKQATNSSTRIRRFRKMMKQFMNQLCNPIPIDLKTQSNIPNKEIQVLGGIYIGKSRTKKQQETAAITDRILDPAWVEPQLQLPALYH